ncbi:MAG: hypothetical protein ABI402_01795 [Ferruginibacter sp.]
MKTVRKKNIYSFLIIFLLSIICEQSIAQSNTDSTVYYFDRYLNFCPSDKMTYIGFGKKENGLVHLSVFTVGDARLTMTGFYTDSTLAVREGEFNNYDITGHKISFLHYHRDTIYGYAVWLTNNYLCRDSIFYENGVDVRSISYAYSKGKKNKKIIKDARTGTKEFTTYFDENGIEISQEIYIKGLIASEPSYPGGKEAFREYLRINLWETFRAQRYSLSSGINTYNLVFWLNKKGEIYDLNVNQLQSNDPIYTGIRQVLVTARKWNMKNEERFGPVYYSFRVLHGYDIGDLKIVFP